MPPRLVFSSVSRSLAIRTRPSIRPPRIIQIASHRGFADDRQSVSDRAAQNPLGHVSEEAAAISRVTGETQPEINQGTRVQDVRYQLCTGCGVSLARGP